MRDAVTTIGVSCSSAPTPKAASAEARKVIAVAGFLHTMMRVPEKTMGCPATHSLRRAPNGRRFHHRRRHVQ